MPGEALAVVDDEALAVVDDNLKKILAPKPTKHILKTVPSGEISVELGADGIWLRFDCDCADALPICQAQCCALVGTSVRAVELASGQILEEEVEVGNESEMPVMKRRSDGFCNCLNRESRSCEIYDRRPMTCRAFHCTRGESQRGWKFPNAVYRQTSV